MDFNKEVYMAFESDEARAEYLVQCFGDDAEAAAQAVSSCEA